MNNECEHYDGIMDIAYKAGSNAADQMLAKLDLLDSEKDVVVYLTHQINTMLEHEFDRMSDAGQDIGSDVIIAALACALAGRQRIDERASELLAEAMLKEEAE